MRSIKILAVGLAAVMLLLAAALSSCSGDIPKPVENEDGTLSWNGWTLTRAVLPYPYREYNLYSDIIAKPNVLAGDEQSLSLVVERHYKHSPDFGTKINIQVLLGGRWYTVPDGLSGEPFILPPLKKKEKLQTPVEYETDLAGVIDLPPGAYRFAEEALEKPGGDISTWYARFWVKSPYAKSPPEAVTEGKARMKDIVMSVDSSYPAQRAITSGDDMFTLVVENLSGKTYKPIFKDEDDRGIVLERLADGRWTQTPYSTANTGTYLWGWGVSRMEVFFRDDRQEETGLPPASLSEGHYRIRFPMKTDEGGLIEPSCEFDVLAPEDAPAPEWDMDELRPSEYEGIEQSTGVIMNPTQSVFSGRDILLEVTLSVSGEYSYGPSFEMEALIDGRWHRVPFADARGFTQPLFIIDENGSGKTERYNISSYFGVIPEGKYRVIELFKSQKSGLDEYAVADFTVVNG